jgi:Na+-translocating ferredoxin:NAD+ oxidoreductase RnfD subunit
MSANLHAWQWPPKNDPRWAFAAIMVVYCVLGTTVLGFNRDPFQILLTVSCCAGFEVLFAWLFRREKLVPLSACITGLGLSLLVNYPHDLFLLIMPAFFAIASKYVLTFQGRHVFNPNLCGVMATLMLGGGRFASAPAYQWGGDAAIVALIVMGALVLFVFRIGRTPLILSFLISFALLTALRAWIMRWHLPAETIIRGTLTSPAFFLFTFYMITDPKTSPRGFGAQIGWGILVAVLDLVFHLRSSLATIFFALFTASSLRWAWLHLTQRDWTLVGIRPWFARTAILLGFAFLGAQTYAHLLHPAILAPKPGFRFEAVPAAVSGVHSELGDLLTRVDPRITHVAKWLLSVGDAVAVGDYDADGFPDLFLTNPLKRAEDRNALYRNLGGMKFQRVALPALADISASPEKFGIVSGALFADYDNSGRQSLILLTGWGKPRLLKNQLMADGSVQFRDATTDSGIDEYTVSVAGTLADFDLDGDLDIFTGNAMSPNLPGYDPPQQFNIFNLPAAENPEDRRMFHFMHSTWHNAVNGGINMFHRNLGGGHFQKEDSAAMGMAETHWTMSIGTADLNQDGWPDLYCASDYGPDDLYLNKAGRGFERIAGTFVGSVGRDTYKGMNVSIGDLDNRGWQDLHVSNVHAPLQAEGSLLWRFEHNPGDPFHPFIRDTASERRVLNEKRFGWGAAMGDLNLDGWLDMVQANGMVDDTPDKRFDTPRDYWYVAGQVMRAGPEVHSYADRWADMRGYEIWGRQKNRVYLHHGSTPARFEDVAEMVGLTAETNSRAAALADFDNDGDLDLVITHQFAPAGIFRNTRTNDSKPHWIGLQLVGDGVRVNRDAIGAQVLVSSSAQQMMREVALTSGFSAQSDRRLHFGLGDDPAPVDVEIRWPGGGVQKLHDLETGRYHRIQFGQPTGLASSTHPSK